MACYAPSITLLIWRVFLFLSLNSTQIWGASSSSTFDYVVVGGGTAGLVVASRLTENPSIRVAVIEAGDFYEIDTGNRSEIPANDVFYNGKSPQDTGIEDWGFTTTPQAGFNGEIVHYARGKALGGSSALNYMAYQRAIVGSLQKWAVEVGDLSYTYANVSSYYNKSLNFTPPDISKRGVNATPEYDTSTLGSGGPLAVTYPNYAQAFSTWVQKGLRQLGFKSINGFTSGSSIGSAFLINTIDHETGKRASSESAFLRPYLNRTNLVVYRNTLAERIIFNGTVATGVSVTPVNSSTSYTMFATKEIVLSAGTFQSPQLLQVSGVGPKDLLKKFNIAVVANRPGVGLNMNDHIFSGVCYRVNVQTGTALQYGDNLEQAINEFNTQQDGLLSGPGGDFGAYEKVPQDLRANFSKDVLEELAAFPEDWPEIEYFTLPSYVGNFVFPTEGGPTDGYQYATIVAVNVAPLSRGNISISSSSTKDQPLINPNWLTNPTDIAVSIAGFKRVRAIFDTPAMANIEIGQEYFPGANITTDADILANIKATFNTMYHASSTCKMGKTSDPMAVVDSKARVIGVQNLRVVDASAFPFLPPGLPQGTVYMLAEKISDNIKSGP